jgi:hypothetical protein
MTAGSQSDRRALLAALAACAAPLGLPARASAPGDVPVGPIAAICACGLLTHREDALLIGRAYLTAAPAERDAVWTDRAIAEFVHAVERGHLAPSGLAQVAAAHQRADFEAGEVVSVSGWILSRFEARLCALLALAEP